MLGTMEWSICTLLWYIETLQSTTFSTRAEMVNESCSRGFGDFVQRDGPGLEKPEKTKLQAVVNNP